MYDTNIFIIANCYDLSNQAKFYIFSIPFAILDVER